jgi:hypothetical protein
VYVGCVIDLLQVALSLTENEQSSEVNRFSDSFSYIFRVSENVVGRAIAQAEAGFDLMSGNVGFVVNEVALGPIFSENFCFPCQFSLHQSPHVR